MSHSYPALSEGCDKGDMLTGRQQRGLAELGTNLRTRGTQGYMMSPCWQLGVVECGVGTMSG